MKLIRSAINIFDRSNEVLFTSAAIIIISMMFLVLANVGLRLLKIPTVGRLLELIDCGLIYFTFLGGAQVLRRGGHVGMKLVVDHQKPRIRDMINTVTSILSAIIWLVLTWWSAQSVWDAYQFGFNKLGLLHIPLASLLVVIPVGSFLLFIQFLRQASGYLKSFVRQKEATCPRGTDI